MYIILIERMRVLVMEGTKAASIVFYRLHCGYYFGNNYEPDIVKQDSRKYCSYVCHSTAQVSNLSCKYQTRHAARFSETRSR